MTDKVGGRICLVTYRVGNGPICWNQFGALDDQGLEGLNLMLAWRRFISGFVGAKREEDVNILSYVDLFDSKQADLAYMENAAFKNDFYKKVSHCNVEKHWENKK